MLSNFVDDCADGGSKGQPCDATSQLTVFKGGTIREKFSDRNSVILKGMRLYNFFAVRVSGTQLFIVINYTRLKPRLILNNFLEKMINLN